MIDYEDDIFTAVASALRAEFPKIYVVGTELSTTPSNFPAVSFILTNNAVRSEYSTFQSLENVATEDYKAEVYSNLITGKEAQTKAITEAISDVMSGLAYERTFCEMIPNSDPTINRRVSRYRKNNVI